MVMDAGYDAPRIAHLPADLPVQVLGRLCSDRVMRRPAPSRAVRSSNARAVTENEVTSLSSAPSDIQLAVPGERDLDRSRPLPARPFQSTRPSGESATVRTNWLN